MNSINDEEMIVDGENGNETKSDADVNKSTASLSTNTKHDIDKKKEQALLQELLNEMDTEINEDIKKYKIDKDDEICQETPNNIQNDDENGNNLSSGMSSPKAKFVKSENDVNFDAYTDGVNIHKKYEFRRKVKPVIKTDTSDFNHKYVDKAPSLRCAKCKKAFNSKTGLLNHMRMHQTVKVYTCSLCDEKFDNNPQLLKHKIKHEGEDRVFLCKTCEMAFTDHCDYLTHEISHTKRSTYKCPECGSYQNPNYIKTHIEQHFNRGKTCGECGKLFTTTSSLNQHVSSYHNDDNNIECVECGKVLLDKKAYERHMAGHTGIKKYQCLYCGKGFSGTQARAIHTRSHTGERPYHCTSCPRTFRQATDLKRHELSHGEKTFECHMCSKKYRHSESLKAHLMVHNQKNLLHCPICNKGCQTRPALKLHLVRKHSTERSFKCDLCDVSFKDGNGLRKHRNSKMHKRAEYGAQKKNQVEI